MRDVEFGGLRARVTGGVDRDGGGDGPAVVLLHGFGAPGDDLVPLARVLDVPREVRFVFPAAPLALGPEYGNGRAWWWVDMVEREIARRSGRAIDIAAQEPPGIDEAREKLVAFLDAAMPALGVAPERMLLGGFSQGAMLALDAFLLGGLRPAGLVLMSGTLVHEAKWAPHFSELKGIPVVQSHGTHDDLLPFDGADRLRARLVAAGAKLDWVRFAGGHEIPGAALDAVARLVRTIG
jgi:phospholipase/carboxylesterase